MKILIVGAGPAGLAVANFLNTEKHDVTVIEKEKEFSTMGFGIFFFNEGKKYFRKATHDRTIHALLKRIGFKRYVDEHGKTLCDIHYNKIFHVRDSDSITSIKREDLHRLLRDHVSEDVKVKMGTTIACIDNKPNAAAVRFSDGTEATFDLVISAEGLHSELRDRFFSYRVKKLPWIARYFWIDSAMKRFCLEWSRDATVMCMPHRDRTTVLSIEHADVYESCNERQIVPAGLREFYESIGLSRQRIETCYRESHVTSMQYVYTDGWFKNRVVLIGDAQHAMTPTLGFGTSLALEDAYQLATALNDMDDTQTLHGVLTRFSNKRSRKVGILRFINRLDDVLMFRRSRVYYNFWHTHRAFSKKVAQMIDGIIRLGWKYA